MENAYLGTVGLKRGEADFSEATLYQTALSSDCLRCARLWVNLCTAKLRGGGSAEAERACRTAWRLGLTSSTVRRALADSLDAQGRTQAADAALGALAAAAAAAPDPASASAEYLGLFFREARKKLPQSGRVARACSYFHAAARQARRAAGGPAVAAVERLQRQVWAAARRTGAKRVVFGCFIQGNTPDGRCRLAAHVSG